MPITCRDMLVAATLATLATAATPACAQMLAQTAVPAPSGLPSQAPGAARPAPTEQLQKPAQAATPATPAPATWMSTLSFGAQVEGGIVLNPQRPADNINFGQLFTDKSNQFQLNQVLLTMQRPTDPKATGYDIGFKLQGLYGSDARYTHFLGELDHATSDRYQFDVVEADVQLHLPWLTAGGIDAKIGQYPSPLGYEGIDPSGNPFYSHSYIFNFGVPFKHTGLLAIWHATPMLDLYGGVDSGENTSLGSGDNNAAAAGIAGFGLNLLGGNLTLLALSHFGPENPTLMVPGANSAYRYENDVVLTWKATPKLSLTTEVNYIRDDAFHADAYGAAQYASYALADTLTLNGRAEVYRDNKGFFVTAFPGNLDYVNSEAGLPASVISAAPTTYSEFTVGLTWKPAIGKPLSNFEIRPELRYDRSLNGTQPYAQGRDSGAFTAAADAIVGF